MTVTPAATIFPGDQRGLHQTATYQSRYTFNFGHYFSEHRHAYSNMYVFNDDWLAGGAALQLTVPEDSWIILIPVAGAVTYKDCNGNTACIVAGQVQVITAGKEDRFEISNPFRQEMVNCLQVWIRMHKPIQAGKTWLQTYDSVNKNINQLVNAFPAAPVPQLPVLLSIGKFTGRGECSYQPAIDSSSLFLFVAEGAFEVEGRLLHAGDALALWNTHNAEIEALSNDAILMVIELPG